jgi:transposase
MDPDTGSRRHRQLTSGQDTWSARCGVIRTPGAAGGPGKPTGSNPGRAPRSDPTSAALGTLVHQLCTAHLLRDLDDAAQVYPDSIWPVQIADALRALIGEANRAREHALAAIPDDVRDELLRRLRNGMLVGLSDTLSAGTRPGERKARLLLEVLRDRPADVLRFAHDLRVPPTSNQAERDLRPSKIQQKISGRLTSIARTQDRYTILGYVSTAAKHGLDKITALRDALTGRPWMPALPAPA